MSGVGTAATRICSAVVVACCLWGHGALPARAQIIIGNQPFTDAFGNTCPADQAITNPNPNGPGTICPQSASRSSGQTVSWNNNPYRWLLGTGGPYNKGYDPDAGLFGPNPGTFLGGPFTFSMYGSDVNAGVDIYGTHNNGYGVSDTAGAIAAGAAAPGFNSIAGGGGFNFTADGTRLLNDVNSRRLLFGLTLDYNHESTNYGTSALTPGVSSAGSERSNTETLIGTANYSIKTLYLSGLAAVDLSQLSITNNLNAPGARGNTNGLGYAFKGTVGNVFPLFNTTGVTPNIVTKAPPRTASGYGVFLDVSGHYAYAMNRDNGFTDSTGFTFGTDRLSYSDVGAQANLMTIIPNGRFAWAPYVGVTVDRQIGFSHTFELPAQAATPADTLIFTESNTYWGVQLGMNLLGLGTTKLGVQAVYEASADTQIYGGSVFLKIPLWEPPPKQDSGIRIATGK